MKKLILALVGVCFCSSIAYGAELPWSNRLPFEQGEVHYALGGMIKGEDTVYVKDSGATTASYRTEVTEMMGLVDKTNELTITTPQWIYTVDLDDKSGFKQMNPQDYMTDKFTALSESEQKQFIKNSETLGITFVGDMSAQIEKGVTEIQGYTCDKVNIMGFESYVMSNTNFPMGVSGKIMGIEVKETVTSIKKGSVDSTKFVIPADIQFEHEELGDKAVKEHIDLMFLSVLAGKAPTNDEPMPGEDAAEGMEAAIKAMQQMQEQDPEMQELQMQMMKLMENKGATN